MMRDPAAELVTAGKKHRGALAVKQGTLDVRVMMMASSN